MKGNEVTKNFKGSILASFNSLSKSLKSGLFDSLMKAVACPVFPARPVLPVELQSNVK